MSSAALIRPTAAGVAPGAASLFTQSGLALLGACIMINDANFRVADPNEVSLDWQTAMRLGLSGLCLGYAVWSLPRACRALTRFPAAWLVLFIGWAWLTLPFAINPTYAFAACTALTSSALFTAALIERVPPEAIVKTIVSSIVILAIGCWIAQFTRPELGQPEYLTPGQEPAWRLGGLIHPNGLGAHCALAIGMLLAGRLTWQWSWRPIVPLTIFFTATLLATGSRTSCLMLAAVAAFLTMRKKPAMLVLALAASAAVVMLAEVFAANWSGLFTGLTRDGNLHEISTMTGRTDLWVMAIDNIGESPVWGFGYGCSRFVFLELANFPATHPHNLFLDTMTETGVTGGLIEAAMVVALLRRLLARPCAWPDMVLLLVVVMGVVEVPIFNPLPEAFTLSWMLALGWRRGESGSHEKKTEIA